MLRKKGLWTTPSADDHKPATRVRPSRKVSNEYLRRQVAFSEELVNKVNQSPQLPLLQADSLASLYLLPGSEEARKMTVGSGLRCLESYQKSSQIGLLQRMLLDSYEWGSTIVYLTWRVRATKRYHFLFQLAVSTPRIGEIESSLWLTPQGTDAMRSSLKLESLSKRYDKHPQGNLAEQVAHRMLPTPTSSERAGDNPKTGKGKGLSKTVKMLPTPKGRDWKGQTQRGQHQPGDALPNILGVTGGQLNPNWVEWLMGFPLGWTDLNV